MTQSARTGDERDAHEDSQRRELKERRAIISREMLAIWKPIREEHDAVQEEDEALPVRATGEAAPSTHDLDERLPMKESRGDGGQNARNAQRLRWQYAAVGVSNEM